MPSKCLVLVRDVLACELGDYVLVEKKCKLLEATHIVQSLFDALLGQMGTPSSA
jgi:hypothetical protein